MANVYIVKLGQSCHRRKKRCPRPQSWTVLVGAETPDHAIQTMKYYLADLFINQGDTVTFVANALDVHTVTFLNGRPQPPFNPTDPQQTQPQGGPVFDNPTQYYNSGLLANGPIPGFTTYQSYTLKFEVVGDFPYVCLLHPDMTGTIHVRVKGTPYPVNPAEALRRANIQVQADLAFGQALYAQAQASSSDQNVYAGYGQAGVGVVRFIPAMSTIHVGQSITWTNASMDVHTVTFGQEPPNPAVPVGDPTNYSGGDLSSGFLFPGQTFTVTFTAAGMFPYICALHDFLGMIGTIIVQP